MKFKIESVETCHALGKVVLSSLNPGPEILNIFISGVTTESKLL